METTEKVRTPQVILNSEPTVLIINIWQPKEANNALYPDTEEGKSSFSYPGLCKLLEQSL